MIKKLLNYSLAFSLLAMGHVQGADPIVPAPVQAPVTKFPTEFNVKERWVSLTLTFDIESIDAKLGTVHRKFFSWTPEYHLKDPYENFQAKAKMRFWSWMTIFDVEDGQGKPLGSVEQGWSWFRPSFTIVSPNHQKLAKASLNFWGTTYTIADVTTDQPIATLTRPFFQFKNNWTVKIVDPAAIDRLGINPNMFLVLIAFQVDREHWNAYKYKEDKDKNKDAAAVIDQLFNPYLSLLDSEEAPSKEEETKQGFCKQLEERANCSNCDVEPTEEDIVAVEAIGNKFQATEEGTPEEQFQEQFNMMLNLLDSEELTPGQKGALFQMLQYRLHQ